MRIQYDGSIPVSANGYVWIGAVSFEDRCVGSLEHFVSRGGRLSGMTLIEYPTETLPLAEADRKRADNRRRLEAIGARHCPGAQDSMVVNPYSFRDIQKIITTKRGAQVIVDVSCLTKVHALAAGAVSNVTEGWWLAYTLPDNYNFGGRRGKNTLWTDIILSPLTENAAPFSEADSRGILILGHENDRLDVALGEVEPNGGLLIYVEAQERPDFRQVTISRNRRIVRRLRFVSRDWREMTVSFESIDKLAQVVREEAHIARAARNAAVIVYPLGPKPIIYAVTSALTDEYPEGSWFTYVVPSHYESDYSFGTGPTFWYRVSPD